MNGSRSFDWETFAEGMDDFYFIAHLLDRVLVGRKDDGWSYQQLLHGVRDDAVLEIRIFNDKEERCAARVSGQMVVYEPLKHDSNSDKNYVIDRCYRLWRMGSHIKPCM